MNQIIDKHWERIMTSRLEKLKILRFVGEGDLEYRKIPEFAKYAQGTRQILGLKIIIKLI